MRCWTRKGVAFRTPSSVIRLLEGSTRAWLTGASAGGCAGLHPARARARPARGIRKSLVMVSTAQPMARQETRTQFSALMVVVVFMVLGRCLPLSTRH